jgi:hypothetical protein
MHTPERWVEKVHPLARGVEADDPMELMASPVPGDPDVMLACLLDEFAWLGHGADELMRLFASPAYPLLNQLLGYFGEGEVRRRVEGLLGQRGTLRFTETLVEEPDEGDDHGGPGLIQLSLDKAIRHRPA